MTHHFSSPLSRDLFALSAEAMQEQLRGANRGVPPFEPDSDFDRWCDAREGEKPVTLPTRDPKEVADEWAKLERPKYRGTPKEL